LPPLLRSCCRDRRRLPNSSAPLPRKRRDGRINGRPTSSACGTLTGRVTAAAAYSWVNAKPAWGMGYADLVANKIHVEVYLH
jgi:hypothetical protein